MRRTLLVRSAFRRAIVQLLYLPSRMDEARGLILTELAAPHGRRYSCRY